MDHGSEMSECTRKWWQFSVIGGAVIAVLLWLFSYGFLTALVIGIVCAVAGGLLLSKVNCTTEDVAPTAKPSVMPEVAASPVASTTPRTPEPESEPTPAAQAAVEEPKAAPPETEAPAAVEEASEAKKAAPKAAAKKAAPKKKAPAKKAPAKKAPAKAASAKAPAASARKPVAADGKPEMLSAARDGGADNLKLLKGVGPKLETTLNELGVYHFDQVAGWRKKEIAWVDDRLKFKGRIERDEWIKQAKVLAKGGETEFSKRSQK